MIIYKVLKKIINKIQIYKVLKKSLKNDAFDAKKISQ